MGLEDALCFRANMATSSRTLGAPLVHETVPRNAAFVGKGLTLLSTLIGFGCAALWAHGTYVVQGSHSADLDKTVLAKIGVAAMKGQYVQLFPSPSSPRSGGMAQVQAMQDTLKKYGIGSSPMQKLALTQLTATRDPSMRAQVREAFSEMDPGTQAKLQRISKEVITRAEVDVQSVNPRQVQTEGREQESFWRANKPGVVAFEALENRDKMPGQLPPFGFWDPANLFGGKAGEGTLYFYREAELKNGRVAMLAVLGLLLTDAAGFRPFYEGPEPYASPVLSHFTPQMAKNFWPSLAIACGIAEIFAVPSGDKAPGDLGFDPLGLKPTDEKEFLELQNKELNNGRLAMMGYAGIIVKELMTGQKVF